MSSTVETLHKKGLIQPPNYVVSNTMFETVTGSIAYGASTDVSDFDIVGFCLPSKEMVFPHVAGQIAGFGHQIKRFEVYEQHHVFDPDAMGGKGREYDFNIYSIVKYFQLCMENNPNMIDTLFTARECVLHTTPIGEMVRERRRLFLHKGSWHKFKGFAYGQLNKMNSKNPEPDSKRAALREKYGFDVKFAYNIIRLLDEAEQILTTGDIDLRRNSAQLKAIRRGEVPKDEIVRMAAEKEAYLEKVYEKSELRYGPDEPAIRKLLHECLEHHYGDLSNCVVDPDAATTALRQIADIINRNQALLAA